MNQGYLPSGIEARSVSIGGSRVSPRLGWAVVLVTMMLTALAAVMMLVPLVVVEVRPYAVGLSSDSTAIQVMDDNWSRDSYAVTETPDEILVERRMAAWNVVTGPPEAVLPVMSLDTKPLSAPLGDRRVVDAATGEPVPLRRP